MEMLVVGEKNCPRTCRSKRATDILTINHYLQTATDRNTDRIQNCTLSVPGVFGQNGGAQKRAVKKTP